MKKLKFSISILVLVLILTSISACNSSTKEREKGEGKIKIVTTLFPQYDFAKEIVKDKAEVTLLLPPGVEAHSFEPTPQDIGNIKKADIFIYTGEYMEPWADKMIDSIGEESIAIVDLSKGIELMEEDDHHDHDDHDHHHHHGGKDPHIWLDPVYAQKMIDNIVETVVKVDKAMRIFIEKMGKIIKRD